VVADVILLMATMSSGKKMKNCLNSTYQRLKRNNKITIQFPIVITKQ